MTSKPKNPLQPQQLWRQRFCRAVEKEDGGALDGLLDQWAADPTLSWAAIAPPHPQDPLGLAIGRFNAWGVAQVLERGVALSEAHLVPFFREIKTSRDASDRVGETFVKRLWPVLLPHVLASEALSQSVVEHYFRGLRKERLARGVDWEALAMDHVAAPCSNMPFLSCDGATVTPLQHAFLSNCPLTAQGLLRAGADPQALVASSGLPGWSLEGALNQVLGGIDYLKKGYDEEIKAYVRTAWGGTSEALVEKMPRLFLDVALFTLGVSWAHVQAQVSMIARAKALEHSLPAPSLSTKNGPRF